MIVSYHGHVIVISNDHILYVQAGIFEEMMEDVLEIDADEELEEDMQAEVDKVYTVLYTAKTEPTLSVLVIRRSK